MLFSWSAMVRKARPKSVRITATIVVMRRAEPLSPRLPFMRIVSLMAPTSEARAVGIDLGIAEGDPRRGRVGQDRHVAPGDSRQAGHVEGVHRPDRVADVAAGDLGDEGMVEDVTHGQRITGVVRR